MPHEPLTCPNCGQTFPFLSDGVDQVPIGHFDSCEGMDDE